MHYLNERTAKQLISVAYDVEESAITLTERISKRRAYFFVQKKFVSEEENWVNAGSKYSIPEGSITVLVAISQTGDWLIGSDPLGLVNLNKAAKLMKDPLHANKFGK